MKFSKDECWNAAVEMVFIGDESGIQFDQFLDWYRRTYPTRVEDVVAQVRFEFEQYDEDNNGTLSKAQLIELLEHMGLSKNTFTDGVTEHTNGDDGDGEATLQGTKWNSVTSLSAAEIAEDLPVSKRGGIRLEDFLHWHMTNHKEEYEFKTVKKVVDKTKEVIRTKLGAVETEFKVGTRVEVFFRGANQWCAGTLTKIVERDSTAYFVGDKRKFRKWVHLLSGNKMVRLEKNVLMTNPLFVLFMSLLVIMLAVYLKLNETKRMYRNGTKVTFV